MIVHIGYHKTGTTYLQRNLFPRLKGIQFYDYDTCRKLLTSIHQSTSLEYEPEHISVKLDKSKKALYSLEALTGTMGLGTYNLEIAHRLKNLGFAKIIITIRRQDLMLEAIYRQYVQQGGVLKSKAFLKNYNFFSWSYLDYYPLVKRYCGLFGQENVLVLAQEELLENSSVTESRIQEFCKAEGYEALENPTNLNRSLSSLSIGQLRIINHFTFNNYRPSHLLWKGISSQNFRQLYQKVLDPYLWRHLSKKHIFSSSTRQKAVELNKENNRLLDNYTASDLKTYGYF